MLVHLVRSVGSCSVAACRCCFSRQQQAWSWPKPPRAPGPRMPACTQQLRLTPPAPPRCPAARRSFFPCCSTIYSRLAATCSSPPRPESAMALYKEMLSRGVHVDSYATLHLVTALATCAPGSLPANLLRSCREMGLCLFASAMASAACNPLLALPRPAVPCMLCCISCWPSCCACCIECVCCPSARPNRARGPTTCARRPRGGALVAGASQGAAPHAHLQCDLQRDARAGGLGLAGLAGAGRAVRGGAGGEEAMGEVRTRGGARALERCGCLGS